MPFLQLKREGIAVSIYIYIYIYIYILSKFLYMKVEFRIFKDSDTGNL